MKTTEVVVELVVVGSGFLAVIGVVIAEYYKWTPPTEVLTNPVFLGLSLFVSSYVMGILVDRVADALFSPVEDYWRKNQFGSVKKYQQSRISSYESSEVLRDWGQYSRVRARVCRGWCVNTALFLLVLFFILKIRSFDIYFLAGATFFLFLWSWIRLARGEVFRLKALQHNSKEASDT